MPVKLQNAVFRASLVFQLRFQSVDTLMAFPRDLCFWESKKTTTNHIHSKDDKNNDNRKNSAEIPFNILLMLFCAEDVFSDEIL